jgi:peptide alpha-N-acetyltransferase
VFKIRSSNSSLLIIIQVEDPLGEAMMYLRLLQDHSTYSLETHLFAIAVYFQKQNKKLALQVYIM